MVCSRHTVPSWLSAASRVDFDGGAAANVSKSESVFADGLDTSPHHHHSNTLSDTNMGFAERSFSAAGAAVLSAILVNPLDVAKTRLQAQAAGVPYSPPNHQMSRCMASLGPSTVGIYLPCYDIFRNWIEEFTAQNAPTLTPYAPLVAGSLARSLACITCSPIELARTRMQAYKEFQIGAKPPGMWKTLVGALSSVGSTSNLQSFKGFRILWMGVGAQLARDVPFSAICWSTLEPIRRRLLGLVGEEANAASVLGANFSAGFVAGSLAAAATCPLDVVKTRRQIEKDPTRAMRMTTRQTLIEVWRDGRMKGLFTGIGPRIARAGPSVGIVVSFYEVVKYALHQRRSNS
ncbi:mitochondrial carrier protein MTM1-like isoform X2 [Magnolia sinica]|uniref:mitochondrial carrier protein MTM1-like isoform X2 n=1 Tax=Magnolia sinica TaxID=86752 RepID=UPI00265AAE06|nr:mitochondrial carrier protein MTM1-like isoform X2 [Magnolia sinica]